MVANTDANDESVVEPTVTNRYAIFKFPDKYPKPKK